jgi:prepilin-type N-terminal cleavage/methylation domain-containing protein
MKNENRLALRISGFTLIELIISIALLGIIITLVLNLNANSREVSTGIINQSSMQQELRTAASIIADEVQRAYYVFPPCGAYTSSSSETYACGTAFDTTNYKTNALNVNFSKFKLTTTAETTIRPDKATMPSDPEARTWTVGSTTAPILAMIVAPREPNVSTKACGDSDSISRVSCYYFVAYYPVLRSTVTRTVTTATSKEKLEPFADNESQWVLMEYRVQLEGLFYNIASSTVTVPGLSSTLTIPKSNWGDAECDDADACKPIPSTNPSRSVQIIDGNLPAIYRGETDPEARARFTGKMNGLVEKINDTSGNKGNILATNINVNGFLIDFPTGSIDERGVTEVRVRLQGGIKQGTSVTKFPPQPLEFFASPRNIPAGFAGN